MSKIDTKTKINLIKMLFDRKLFYLLGWGIGVIISIINKLFDGEFHIFSIFDLIIYPISTSFMFGCMLYLIIKEPERLKKEGRNIIFSKDILIHFILTFVFIIIIGILYNLYFAILQ